MLKSGIFLLSLFWAEHALALDLQTVQAHYRGIKELAADVDQRKTSPLLLRPLKSKVKLSFADNTLTWKVEGQEPWRIRFGADGKAEFLGADKSLAEIPADAKAKLDRTLAMLRKILVMDPGLDQDFLQVMKDRRLTIVPRSKDLGVFFESVIIDFKPSSDIDTITLKTADDETVLSFLRLSLKRS